MRCSQHQIAESLKRAAERYELEAEALEQLCEYAFENLMEASKHLEEKRVAAEEHPHDDLQEVQHHNFQHNLIEMSAQFHRVRRRANRMWRKAERTEKAADAAAKAVPPIIKTA